MPGTNLLIHSKMRGFGNHLRHSADTLIAGLFYFR